MNARSQACSRSLSERGVALWRIAAAVAAVVVLVVILSRVFRTREERLWEFMDAQRASLLEQRAPGEQAFLAGIDRGVRYQKAGGFAEVERDTKRFRASGTRDARIEDQEATMTAGGAEVRLTVILMAGLQPVARSRVRFLTAEVPDSPEGWRITEISWE